MKSKIIIDSAGDITVLDGIDFASVPLKIIAGDVEFTDDNNLDVENMIDFLKNYNGKVSSACPGVGEFSEKFDDADNIYIITITSGLSGSYNSASIAAKTYKADHPDRNIYVVDSLSAGPEMVLLAEKIRDLVAKGLVFDQVVSKIEEYKKKTHLIFALQSLHNFVNNGRIPVAAAKFVGLLNMRLLGKASDAGKLQPTGKARGDKKTVPELMKNLMSMGYAGGKVRISHCHNLRCAEDLKSAILTRFPGSDINIYSTRGLCSFYAEEGGLLVGFETN